MTCPNNAATNTSKSTSTSCLLDALRLEQALALLGEHGRARLPEQKSTPQKTYLQALIDGLCELSLRDPLTGLANRRRLVEVLNTELDRVARSGDGALLLMIDVDHFKQVNDQYGHLTGDLALKHTARLLQQCLRPMDTIARYGGEEFAAVLPACQVAYGRSVAERMRQIVQNHPLPLLGQQRHLHLSVSIGGAYALQWVRSTHELWIERADQQLYLAKNEGRNRVYIEPQPDSTVSAEEKNLLFCSLNLDASWLSEDSDAAGNVSMKAIQQP